MNGAPVRKFRNELKDHLDKSLSQPIRINRKEDSFILMNIEHYMSMKFEIENLQRELLGAMDIVHGKTKDIKEFKF